MRYDRPLVLSIAGFDPCGGAGVLADMKTVEQHRCLGLAVTTCMTEQVEDKFISVLWLPARDIIQAIKGLTDHYEIDVVKIGLIENLDTLYEVVTFLKEQQKRSIIWDPVLASSSGFDFKQTIDPAKLIAILKAVFLITPNVDEAKKLSGLNSIQDAAAYLAEHCQVLLKGGHSETEKGTDHLFWQGQQLKIGPATAFELAPKHGSGCILSAAIASQLALKQDLATACQKAKRYVEERLNSNSNLLAYHVA